MKTLLAFCLAFTFLFASDEKIELLALDIISYDDFVQEDPQALECLKKALYEKGIVGIKGIPGYKEKVLQYIETARAFSALPNSVKESYAPNRDKGETFLGYEAGKERFKRPDGEWVVDDLKVSYYAFVPECPENKWPIEVDLKNPFQDLAAVMAQTGKVVMQKIGLLHPHTEISDLIQIGRLLYYRKNTDSMTNNPFWCGAHLDHGIFTALLPAFYFSNGEAVPEPIEAGLFINSDGKFKKVVADDPDVLLFQVGEFGQLATNDAIRATEHRVHKANCNVERFTMALFINASMETVIHSSSRLTADTRYGGMKGDPCSYGHWHEESFKRYLVK